MLLTAVLTPAPEGGFTALNPETATTSQGASVDEALANLREATALYLPADVDVERAWLEEAQRRHRDIVDCRVRPIPGERVFESLRERLKR